MLSKTKYLVKERVGVLKLTDIYDIYDAESGKQLGQAKENPGVLVKFMRLLVNKQVLPTKIEIRDCENSPPLVTIKKPFTFFRSKVWVQDRNGKVLGYFRQKLITVGGAFNVFDPTDKKVAMVQGDWKGWNFRFTNDKEEEIGVVTKKWAGIGKELFTSADNYFISLNGEPNETQVALLLAAGLAVDIIYKEK